MKFRTYGFLGIGFFFLLICFSPPTEARVSVGLSIGTSLGHRYPGYCYGYHPYHTWSGLYDPWFDGDYHVWMRAGRYRRFHRRHYWPRRSSHLGIWIGGYTPVVVDAPIIVHNNSVERSARQVGENVAARVQLNKTMQRKKNEQLRALETEDKEKRIQAIRDLAGFSHDNKVRQALEDILLSDPDPEYRKEAALSLGRTENRLALTALTEAKENDTERKVRQAAYRSIIMIKGY